MTKVPHDALVVVADGGRALFLRAKTGHGDATATLHQLDDVAPGGHGQQSPSGSRPEDQTPRQTDEAGFAMHVARRIEAMNRGGEAADIVIVADPQTLGQIRSALHKSVAAHVAFTLDKDLTHHTLPDIAKALH